MPALAPTDASWVVALHLSADAHTPIGCGVLIDSTRVITIRHAVEGQRDLWATFPMSGSRERRTVVSADLGAGFGDDGPAVLTLEASAPVGANPALLRNPAPKDLREKGWWAFGFPQADPAGNEAHGTIGATLAFEWMRVDTASAYPLEQGFSGSGVWCPDYGAVIGIVGSADERGNGKAIGLKAAIDQLPAQNLGELTRWSASSDASTAEAWGWELSTDPQATLHWRPRARGVANEAESGYRFRGRTQALTEIVDWLTRPPKPEVLVVTGSPGVGKSAVLARIVTTADAALSAALPGDEDAVKAPVGLISCAVHAKNKTARDVLAEIAAAVSAPLPAAGALQDELVNLKDALEATERRFNLVVDALDEAASPYEARLLIRDVLRPMAENLHGSGVSVVVGTRRHDGDGNLIGAFTRACATIDLDSPTYFKHEDLAAYALTTLQDSSTRGAYAKTDVAEPVAERIAELAVNNFLVAGLEARSHGLHDVEAVSTDELDFGPDVGQAFRRYLERTQQSCTVLALDGQPIDMIELLTVLALTEAPGIPVELWTVLNDALDHRPVDAKGIVTFVESAGASFILDSTDAVDGRVFRLFHQALNDALLSQAGDMPAGQRRRLSADHAAITNALLQRGDDSEWNATNAYAFRSLPHHAQLGSRVDAILANAPFLLRADLRRVLTVVAYATTRAGRDRAKVLRHCLEAAETMDVNERAAQLSLSEVMDQLATDDFRAATAVPYVGRWSTVPPRSDLLTLTGHTGLVTSICAYTMNGHTQLATTSDDHTARTWNPTTGQQLHQLNGHTNRVTSICAYTINGHTQLATTSRDGTARTWDPTTGQQLHQLNGHTNKVTLICAYTINGHTQLATTSDDGTARTWDPTTGDSLHTIRLGTSLPRVIGVGSTLIFVVGSGMVAVDFGRGASERGDAAFLAFAGPDEPSALKLKRQLERWRIDALCSAADLRLGDEWDRVLPERQRGTAATVILVSKRTAKAHYERSEITRAINLARRLGHRLLPIFLEPLASDEIPYGLENIHSWTLSPDFTLADAARKLASELGTS